jgi:hypothetical protein
MGVYLRYILSTLTKPRPQEVPMAFGPQKKDENPVDVAVVCAKAGAGEVETALDVWMPSGSMIRNARVSRGM